MNGLKRIVFWEVLALCIRLTLVYQPLKVPPMKVICTYLLVLISLCSCGKKGTELSAEEQQKQQELQEPLKSNELLEREGLRFRVRSSITDTAIIEIDLQLYKGTGLTKSTQPLAISEDGIMNYSIVSNLMENNCDYTLTIEYNKILQNAPYELFTEGFTSMSGSKEFLITGHSFNINDAKKSKDLMVIKKGILKFTLFELPR